MLETAFLCLRLLAASQNTSAGSEQLLIQQIAESGRCVEVGQTPDARVLPRRMVPPGPPPLLSFRYYEGKLHHRFTNSDLMLDDAGH